MILRLLLALVLTAIPSLASAGIAYVQGARDSTHAGGSTDAVTLNNVQVGSLLVFTNINSNAQTTSGVADSESTTTWAQCTELAGPTSGYRNKIWWAIAKIAGTHTVTITFSAGTVESASALMEYTGARTVACNAVDGQEQTNPGTGANAITSTAQTTTEAGELVVGSTAEAGGTGDVTAGTGFTCRLSYFEASPCDGTHDALVFDLIQTTPASVAATATTTDATALYTTVMATFVAHRPRSMTLGVGN